MGEAGGANFRNLGYFGADCPNGNPNPHVYPVTMTSSTPVEIITGPPMGPETPVEPCPYCDRTGANDDH